MANTFSDDLMPLQLIARRETELRTEWRRSVQDARRRLVAVLGEHFRLGTVEGWYRELDREFVAHLVMSMIRRAVTHVETRPRSELAAAVHDFVLHACTAGRPAAAGA